jgi:hypothetical protein
MGKSLAQITFEFSGETDTPEVNPSPITEVKTEVEMKDTIVECHRKECCTGCTRKKGTPVTQGNCGQCRPGYRFLKTTSFSKNNIIRCGEVAGMFRENQSLIRYWETEFDILQPRKNRKGDRFFPAGRYQKSSIDLTTSCAAGKFTIEGGQRLSEKE